jgi:integrase
MYDIRHIAASEMLARQADLVAVAAQLGHSTTQTTASNYSHVVPNAQQRAAELLPPLFD